MTQTYNPVLEENEVINGIYKTSITGLWYVSANRHSDERGFFQETAIIDDLNAVIDSPFISRQINLANSKQNVARGFHIENWNKLITVIQGTIFCCIADIRPDSPTYKKSCSFMLGESPDAMTGSLFIQKGLANSYCVVKGPAQYVYVVDALYRERDKSQDESISLFDPELAIDWPIPKDNMLLSSRDLNAKFLK